MGVCDGRIKKSKSQERLGNLPFSLSQTGSIRSQPTESASDPQPITKQFLVAEASDNEPEWQDAGEDSMDSQDAKYNNYGSSEERIGEHEEDTENAEHDLHRVALQH